MHIIVVNDYGYITGGAGKVAIETAIGLADLGNDVVYFCAVGPVCDELKESRCRVVCLGQNDINHKKNKFLVLKEGTNNKKATKAFESVLSSFNGERVIVHIHSWIKAISSAPFKLLKKHKNAHAILTLHDYFTVCPNGGLYDYKHKHICHIKSDFKCALCNCDKRNYAQKLFRLYRYKKQRMDMACVHNFIYISNLNKTVFLDKYKNESNMFYVQNPIDSPKVFVERPESNDHFLYIGRLSEEKGVEELCSALTDTNQKGFIIGDGPLYEKLKTRFKNLTFTGWLNREQMVPYILKSKAFVFPSKWYEGAPLIVPEMISCGLPCIVSDKSSAVEYFEGWPNRNIYSSQEELKELLLSNAFTKSAQNQSTTPERYFDYLNRTYEALK